MSVGTFHCNAVLNFMDIRRGQRISENMHEKARSMIHAHYAGEEVVTQVTT